MRPTLSTFVATSTTDVINFSFFSVILVTTVLRLLFRRYVVPKMARDDIYMIFSALFGLAFIIVIHFEMFAFENVYDELVDKPKRIQDKVSYLLNDNTLANYAVAARLQFWDNLTQTISVTLAKMALIAFYRRLTKIQSHLWVLLGLDIFLVLNCISNVLVLGFQTKPVDCYFHLDRYDGGADPTTCKFVVNSIVANVVNHCIQVFIDLLLAGLPWLILYRMNISLRDKAKLVMIYSVGLTSMTCSAARIWSLDTAEFTLMEVYKSQFIFSFLTMLECFAAILCANIPILVGGLLKLQKRPMDREHVYQQYSESMDRKGSASTGPYSRNGSLSKDPYEIDDDNEEFSWA